MDHEEAEKLIVSKEDFEFAFEHDIKPDFGISDGKLDQYVKYGTFIFLSLIASSIILFLYPQGRLSRVGQVGHGPPNISATLA